MADLDFLFLDSLSLSSHTHRGKGRERRAQYTIFVLCLLRYARAQLDHWICSLARSLARSNTHFMDTLFSMFGALLMLFVDIHLWCCYYAVAFARSIGCYFIVVNNICSFYFFVFIVFLHSFIFFSLSSSISIRFHLWARRMWDSPKRFVFRVSFEVCLSLSGFSHTISLLIN